MEFVWFVLAVAAMAAMAWLGLRIEPHWVAKNGRRMLCMGQLLSPKGETLTRWRETKVFLAAPGEVHVEQKMKLRRRASSWSIQGESTSPPRKRVVFLLRGYDLDGAPALLALKLPVSSKGVDILRRHAEG